ncbi:hypothetical protein [Halomonas sp. 328]|uniref:hypothetical protein n=1 Tax=Halomonas sp. 328 TaxID=2776704 RepID=UPI0018A7B581|nr:hypothetical protein [Halomonas sp. 328]MBF8221769.1 hypothetical protein [Halomonas sp. 328]
MNAFWSTLAMAAAFGLFIGMLLRLALRRDAPRPAAWVHPLGGLAAGLVAFFLYQGLAWLARVPDWVLPLLVILLAWYWLRPREGRLGIGRPDNGHG